MSFRLSGLFFNGGNDLTSYIFNTNNKKLLVNKDRVYDFIFAYKIEAPSYKLNYTNMMGNRFSKSPNYPPLLFTIFLKDTDENIWETSFLRECEFLGLFQLGGSNQYIPDSIHLYQDLPLVERDRLEQNKLTSISFMTDTRCYVPITLRKQQSSIGSKNAVVNFTLYADQQVNEMNQVTEYIDYSELYLRIDEISGEYNFLPENADIPQMIKYGRDGAPSLYTKFENPIHQVLLDSLTNQFYSYFSKKKLNTLTFSKSTEVIEELPIFFNLVNKEDFKPDFI